jgi:hypothetical protein
MNFLLLLFRRKLIKIFAISFNFIPCLEYNRECWKIKNGFLVNLWRLRLIRSSRKMEIHTDHETGVHLTVEPFNITDWDFETLVG